MNIYDIRVKDAQGNETDLSAYRGKVLLIVNTATRCGFAPQFDELEEMHGRLHEKGLEILSFPCGQFANQEPGDDAQIQNVCTVQLGLTYRIFAKIDVNGPDAHPLYVHLRQAQKGIGGDAVKWNFTKFLVDRRGNVVSRHAPITKPGKLIPEIERLLAQEA